MLSKPKKCFELRRSIDVPDPLKEVANVTNQGFTNAGNEIIHGFGSEAPIPGESPN